MKRKIQITESELVNLIKGVINEQNQSYFGCLEQPPGGGPCQCIPLIVGQPNPPIQNNMAFPSMQACQNSPHVCCGGDVRPQEWCCVGGVTGQGQCIQVPGGTCNQGNMGTGYAGGPFATQQDCNTQCGAPDQAWACVNGNCVNQPNGQFATLADCHQMCGEDRFDCVDNRCTRIPPTDPGYSDAPFQTMDDCLDSMCGDRRRPDNPRGPRGQKHDRPRNDTMA